jgi:hypothetical protein
MAILPLPSFVIRALRGDKSPARMKAGRGKFVLERRCQHPDATEIIASKLAARELRKSFEGVAF